MPLFPATPSPSAKVCIIFEPLASATSSPLVADVKPGSQLQSPVGGLPLEAAGKRSRLIGVPGLGCTLRDVVVAAFVGFMKKALGT